MSRAHALGADAVRSAQGTPASVGGRSTSPGMTTVATLRSQVEEFSRFLQAQRDLNADTTAGSSMSTSWCLQVVQLPALQPLEATELTTAVANSSFSEADKARMGAAITERLAHVPARAKDKPTQDLLRPEGYPTQAQQV